MFRLLATLAAVLLYVAHTQSSPTGTHSEPCDADACNKTCNKQYDGWNDNDVIGKCDNNKCRCYHRSRE
ncbi:hypothetical protein V5799_004088 [Amblyomma americanum]|uniref:Secreted protein n=1 Tax=Amblyomma americanum TaxID=6943 RepID=A0AAQ4D736_AMBAM